jgi:hypothetical protein
MRRPLALAFILALLACDPPTLHPEARDAVGCSLAHGAAWTRCAPTAEDPLADAECADAVRVMIARCVPPSWQPPK